MLYREQLEKQLDEKLSEFRDFDENQSRDLAYYLEALTEFCRISSSQISRQIIGNDNVGAIPSEELDRSNSFSVEFSEKWQNHEQARIWASEVLKNRTTFAADASQILPGRDISLPVAAIQVGWFENPHDSNTSYEKKANVIIMSPKELLEDQEVPINTETRVTARRFKAEVDCIAEFLKRKRDWQERGEMMPVAFFDNTLLVSFSLPKTALQGSYIKQILALLKLSAETRIPVIGYVDSSYSKDILNMLDAFDERKLVQNHTLYDSSVMRQPGETATNILKNWGDRSVFCFSRRKGLDDFIDPETDKSLVGFIYLQTTAAGPPARVDLPAWVFETGKLDEILDIVRAECVIGLGYPYAIETADATAVIGIRDRDIFLGALQEFAKRGKLNFSVSRKSTSKGRRR